MLVPCPLENLSQQLAVLTEPRKSRKLCGIPDGALVISGDACCHEHVNKILGEVMSSSGNLSKKVSDEEKSKIAKDVAVQCMAQAMTEDEVKILLCERLSLKN